MKRAKYGLVLLSFPFFIIFSGCLSHLHIINTDLNMKAPLVTLANGFYIGLGLVTKLEPDIAFQTNIESVTYAIFGG